MPRPWTVDAMLSSIFRVSSSHAWPAGHSGSAVHVGCTGPMCACERENCACVSCARASRTANLWIVTVVGGDDPSVCGLNLRAYGSNESDAILYAQGGQGDGEQLLALALQLELETCRKRHDARQKKGMRAAASLGRREHGTLRLDRIQKKPQNCPISKGWSGQNRAGPLMMPAELDIRM